MTHIVFAVLPADPHLFGTARVKQPSNLSRGAAGHLFQSVCSFISLEGVSVINSHCSPIGVADASGGSAASVLHLLQSFPLKMEAASLTAL